jgi:hypothetical protein
LNGLTKAKDEKENDEEDINDKDDEDIPCLQQELVRRNNGEKDFDERLNPSTMRFRRKDFLVEVDIRIVERIMTCLMTKILKLVNFLFFRLMLFMDVDVNGCDDR